MDDTMKTLREQLMRRLSFDPYPAPPPQNQAQAFMSARDADLPWPVDPPTVPPWRGDGLLVTRESEEIPTLEEALPWGQALLDGSEVAVNVTAQPHARTAWFRLLKFDDGSAVVEHEEVTPRGGGGSGVSAVLLFEAEEMAERIISDTFNTGPRILARLATAQRPPITAGYAPGHDPGPMDPVLVNDLRALLGDAMGRYDIPKDLTERAQELFLKLEPWAPDWVSTRPRGT